MAPSRPSRHAENPAGNRRAPGALEAGVLSVLWEAEEPLNPAQVRERLTGAGEDDPGSLAYTTIVTILTRMVKKNVLSRERDGRAFRYAPVTDATGMAARRLSGLLDAAPDRRAVLSRFIEDLSDRDEELLRAVLESRAEPAGNGQG